MDERAVERIRKLLALANSSNPHEAALAAERATEIAQRHNLDLASLGPVESERFVQRELDVGGAAPWRWLLMSAIARATFCRALRRRTGARFQSEMFVIGERHNLAVCEFLFAFLARAVDRLAERGWRRARAVYGAWVEARAWKNDFRRGAVATISTRLAERTVRFAAESAAASSLVIDKEAAIESAFARLHPDAPTRTVRLKAQSHAFSQGQHEASQIELRDALTVNPVGQRALPGQPA
jgi:hypothetical protein